jgi:hypothetical protein
MAAIIYSKAQLIERIKKHIAGDFTGNDFKITDNEVLLYIDAGIPFVLKGQMFENVKITGVFEVPDAYLVTYLISPLTRNTPTNEWVGTLPQTPLALPTGYNITDAYISQVGSSNQSIFITSGKRVPYRNNLPKPSGLFARVEYNKIYLQAPNGMPLSGQNLYVQMPISRTSDVNDAMNIPDDAIQPLFDYVVGKIAQRFSLPKDIVQDNLPSGNKSS